MTTDAIVVDVTPDWTVACDVQRRFMGHPQPSIENLSYAARCRQMRELGGDCYDFMPLPHGRLAFAVGDASGKGLAAALMIANVQSSLRTAASFAQDDTTAVVRAVNRQAYTSSLLDRYATLFYGVFDEGTHTLRYVNAGHNSPFVVRENGSIARLETGGVPVGVFADSSYEEGMIRMNPGDLLVAYTDGVTEAFDRTGREWGEKGLGDAVAESGTRDPEVVVERVFRCLDEFSGGCLTDDATVLIVRVN